MTDKTVSITGTLLEATYYVVAGVRINLKTGDVSIPEGMEISEASKLFWESLKQHARNN